MSGAWAMEATRLAVLALLGLVVGLLSGELGWSMAAVAAIALAFHLLQLYRLHHWIVNDEDRQNPPDAGGVWGELIDVLYRFGKRHRKRKERLARLLERFNEFTGAMPDANVVIGPQSDIRWMNEAAVSLLGLDQPADLGQRITNLIRHPEFVQFLRRGNYSEALEFPAPRREDMRLSVRVVPFGNNERLIAARDVSHFYRIERMRRDFVANVSHELRTPLTVLAGYLETYADMADEMPAPLRPSLEHMQGQTARMQQIVDDLLTLSRLDSENVVANDQLEVAVPGIVSTLREDAEALSGGQHEIVAEVDAGLWLRGEAKELHSALSNLVSNAVRYTPAGGRIELRWAAESGGGARFEVSDSGIGIAPADIPRVTERFYRVDKDRSRATGGTGLGLAIVKHVLQRHGARLELRSRLGEGSTFACVFPPGRVVRKSAKIQAV
jgi:two-component system, OmpR family, phosphate regulon sensor histidine kinase PhoR